MKISRWITALATNGVLLFVVPLTGMAAVSGNCSNCHTMHNSEQGAPVAFTRNASGEVLLSSLPLANLLRTDCVGCHTDGTADTIRSDGETRVPIVFNLLEPTYPPNGSATSTLAGGNFHWILSGDGYGHNVAGISAADGTLNHAPGWEARSGECISCHGTLADAQSGCSGCHVPMHHAAGSGVVAGQDHGWYRFLGSVMQAREGAAVPTQGVIGIEDPNWEQNPVSNRHNVYQGKPGLYNDYLDTGSIGQKCAGCHGNFHSNVGEGSPWIRHPIDVAIPNEGEFVDFINYDPMVPVSRLTVGAGDENFSQISRGSDMVTCISCHRPHGSPYPSMLRWGYRDWPGIDSHTNQPAWNGCAVCHTYKD